MPPPVFIPKLSAVENERVIGWLNNKWHKGIVREVGTEANHNTYKVALDEILMEFVHTDVEGKKTDWMVWKLATTRGTVDLYDNNIYEDDKMSAYKVSP